MDLAKKAIVFLLLTIMAVSGASMKSIIHEVGDVGGWNSDSDVDYYDWAASREFHIGDYLRKLTLN